VSGPLAINTYGAASAYVLIFHSFPILRGRVYASFILSLLPAFQATKIVKIEMGSVIIYFENFSWILILHDIVFSADLAHGTIRIT